MENTSVTGAAPVAAQSPPPSKVMESWLLDVKRVRIPRPKFAGGVRRPREPPKDYYGCGDEARGAVSAAEEQRALAAATEELRRAVQEKL